ncbi:MAG: rod-binding protein [Phycisphaerales bacterium]|nr:MAG: rod-binding protein [Phycisphaerales bacterium]
MVPVGTTTDVPKTPAAKLDRLRDATREIAGSVFYGTLLKTMRASKLKGIYGHGGRGEEIFAAQLDGIMAQEMGRGTKGGIADAMYESLKAQQERIGRLHSAGMEDGNGKRD